LNPREAGGGSQIQAKLAITELLYRYAELIDTGDFDGVGQLLARATFAGTRSASTSGADAIAKLFAMTTRRFPEHGNTPRTRHLVLNPIVEISSERTASARSTFCVIQNTETVPLQPIVVGRYFDTFSCDPEDGPGGWYFTARQVDVQMIGDISAHLMFDPSDFDR
jgi:3-phenylpropionate/cinnamic acid dioxygenase small subunit